MRSALVIILGLASLVHGSNALLAQDSAAYVVPFKVRLRTTAPNHTGPVTLLSVADSGVYVLNMDPGKRRAMLPVTPGTFVPVERIIGFDLQRRNGKGRGAAVGAAVGLTLAYIVTRSIFGTPEGPNTSIYFALGIGVPLTLIGKGIGGAKRPVPIQGSPSQYRNEKEVLMRAVPRPR